MISVKNRTYGVFRITIVAVSFLVLASMTAVGQTSEPSATPTPEPVPSPTPLNYFIRDLPPRLVLFNNKYISFQANFALLADNTIIGQDPDQQVTSWAAGEQVRSPCGTHSSIRTDQI